MLELALMVIAICEVARTVIAVLDCRRHPDDEVTEPHARAVRYPDLVFPAPCGIAVHYAGLTDACARRRTHDGRCMSEAEISDVADGAHAVALEPSAATAADQELRVDIAAIGRHVDSCPLTLFSSPHLTADEVAWVSRTRLMVEALVSGDRFSEWGATKG